MKAVWSFWTKPYFANRHSDWCSAWDHWLAWGLSLATASRHYPDTHLVTDDEGARILVDELQLPFRRVSTELNGMRDEDPQWWALGKLEAYRLQTEPFVHIDTDVFLWKRLRPQLEGADVFTQSPEPLPGFCYRPEAIERWIGYPESGWLPAEWSALQNCAAPAASCCGILGGCRTDFVRHYAESALRILRDTRNRPAMATLPGKSGHMMVIEQYMLNTCVEYHRERAGSEYQGVEIRYLFSDLREAFRPERAMDEGFTHLASSAKRNPRVAYNLERRVQQDLPDHFERCTRYAHAAGVSVLPCGMVIDSM